MISRKVGFLLFLMLAASAALGSSETAFETFKGFEGKWAIRSGQKTLPIEMTYESGSRGSIVTEDRKSTRLNPVTRPSRMPSSA